MSATAVAFEVGDVVQLSAIGLAELATSNPDDRPDGVPYGYGTVVDLAVIFADDVLVEFGEQLIQCDPAWLIPIP